ncbi:prolipoprotein diacylglyceryl transferase [Arthrobacter alpinus]|uniref:Phosphatidylglycerol--prolipoprotein diacylglyceryl transferase n=1 Tax=Arthrobacter alpinus TaxID=656366 RepID=A0A0S2M4L3_9MICC|nr:prolipoprotein diacylglyceryl transferase [Arthrobacter alpinus]ALO68552.1 prolipoprotein diacylglyceryl transferase [Arthrobacter alpinus]
MSTLVQQSLGNAVVASIPAPTWSGFDLGPLRIHAYALCILAGIVAALWLTDRRWKRRGGPEGSIWDIAIWAIPSGIIGGRLYHVFSSPDAYFGPGYDGTGDLSLIPQLWLGGLGIWGAVVLGVVGAWIGCRRANVKISAFIDAAAPGILLAQAIGRWGNYFNQELFGGPTTQPWGLSVSPEFVPVGFSPDTLFHPTFLYECLWNLAGVAVLLLLDRKLKLRNGRLFLLYAMIYTAGRVWIEMLRIDTAEQITFFGITARLNVWTSIIVFVVALVAFIVIGMMRRGRADDSVFLPGREPSLEEVEAKAAVKNDAGTSAAKQSSTKAGTKPVTDAPTASATAEASAAPVALKTEAVAADSAAADSSTPDSVKSESVTAEPSKAEASTPASSIPESNTAGVDKDAAVKDS